MDEIIAQIFRVPRQTLGPSVRVVGQHCKDHGIDSHRPKPVTDAIGHAAIDSLSEVSQRRAVRSAACPQIQHRLIPECHGRKPLFEAPQKATHRAI
jgi:hypothetical protein